MVGKFYVNTVSVAESEAIITILGAYGLKFSEKANPSIIVKSRIIGWNNDGDGLLKTSSRYWDKDIPVFNASTQLPEIIAHISKQESFDVTVVNAISGDAVFTVYPEKESGFLKYAGEVPSVYSKAFLIKLKDTLDANPTYRNITTNCGDVFDRDLMLKTLSEYLK